MPWYKNDEYSSHRFWIIMVYITIVGLFCSYGLYKSYNAQQDFETQAKAFAESQRDFNTKTAHFAHDICEASNGGRQALYDTLGTIKKRVLNSPQGTEKEREDAAKIYTQLQNQIHFSKCPPPIPADVAYYTQPTYQPWLTAPLYMMYFKSARR